MYADRVRDHKVVRIVKRINSRLIAETPFGAFYGGFHDVLEPDRGRSVYPPSFYAETESGEVTVNGVTYTGTVYAQRYREDGDLYLSVQHLTRWDGDHFRAASDSARAKLSAVLLPAFTALGADSEALRLAKIASLESSARYALVDANREIDAYNKLAEQLRGLGAVAPAIDRFDTERRRYVNVAAPDHEPMLRVMTEQDVRDGRVEY